MTGLAELQSGQVAFISGLLGGFALSVATQLLRIGFARKRVLVVFVSMLLTTLLFLLALYAEVRLGIELAGVEILNDAASQQLDRLRAIGTAAASAGFLLLLASIALLAWLSTPWVGIVVSLMVAGVLAAMLYLWLGVLALRTLI